MKIRHVLTDSFAYVTPRGVGGSQPCITAHTHCPSYRDPGNLGHSEPPEWGMEGKQGSPGVGPGHGPHHAV